MNKKNIYKILFCFLLVLLLILLFILVKYPTNNKKENSNNYYYIQSNIPLIKQIPANILEQETANIPNMETRESVITSPGTPYHSSMGWSSNLIGVNDGSATVEIFNNSNEDIQITEDFIMYIGSDEFDNTIDSNMTNGIDTILKPKESILINVENGGDAKYLTVGYGNSPINWVMYPVKTFMDRVSNEEQIKYDKTKNSNTFELEATISPHIFKDLNIGTLYSRKISANKYQNLKITKQEKNSFPNSTLGTIKVDIYNKTEQTLKINNLTLLYKENNKVIKTEELEFFQNVNAKDCKFIEIPFKYYGNNRTTTIILNTNFGNITIHNPDILFSVIVDN